MLRGDLDKAKDYLIRAVALATENGNKWYAAPGGTRSLLSPHRGSALAKALEALNLAEDYRRSPGHL